MSHHQSDEDHLELLIQIASENDFDAMRSLGTHDMFLVLGTRAMYYRLMGGIAYKLARR